MQRNATRPVAATDWWWLGPGLALVLTPIAAFATRWGAIGASHPAYAILLGVTATLGVLLIWLGVGRTARRGAPSRIATRIALIAFALIVGGLAWTLRPLAATEIAIAAMVDGPRVTVAQTSTSIGLVPTDSPQPAELVFYPGGLVDPRAYANILRPIAEAGYPVIIVKPPLGFAFLAQGSGSSPEAGKATVVGGHSLGGVVAARDAGNNAGVDGLLLWAAYPAESIADRTGLAALSIYGSEDGLTTPPEVAESVANLPPSTTFVEVAGAVHSQFGDYGDQRGDGVPTISRDAAQVQIVAATLELLDSVSRRIAP